MSRVDDLFQPRSAVDPQVIGFLLLERFSMMALSGLVERVAFHSRESGFCVLRVKLADQKEPVTVVGRAAAAVQPGEVVRAEGRWQADPTWGPQFRA